jgi:Ricin-type beta-trefoil lectin domain
MKIMSFVRPYLVHLLLVFAFLSGCIHVASAAVQGPYLPPSGKRLLIIGQDVNSIADYSSATGITPGGVTNYINIADLSGLTTDVDNGAGLNNLGRLYQSYPNSVLQIGVYLVNSLGNINNGQLDPKLDELIRILKSWQRPIFLRWGYEFDGPWNAYDPTQFVNAWKRMHGKVKAAGANNIVMVWQSSSYCTSGGNQITYNNNAMSSWWPGAQYVDWIGFSYFRPDDCSNRAINNLVTYARNQNKPLMIAESTPQRYDIGSLTYSNSISANDNISTTAAAIWSNWFVPYFNYISQNSDVIKAVSYINADWDSQRLWAPPYTQGYWGDSRTQANATIKTNWRNEISKAEWLHGSSTLFSQLGGSGGGGSSSSASSTGGGTTPPTGQVIIRARNSNACLDIAGNGTANGTNVHQWACHSGNNQKWIFNSKGSGWYEIKSVSSNRCLDVAGISSDNGANIQIWDCSSGNNQQYKLTSVGSGYYLLTARHSNKCINVSGNSTANGANVIQWTCNNSAQNEHFKFN